MIGQSMLSLTSKETEFLKNYFKGLMYNDRQQIERWYYQIASYDIVDLT